MLSSSFASPNLLTAFAADRVPCSTRLAAKLPGAQRFATFNVSLAGTYAGQLKERLEGCDDPQARAVAEIIQTVDPDVLLLNEFDFDPSGETLDLFLSKYLGPPATRYPHRFTAPVNTGLSSGFDLDRDGTCSSVPGTDEYARDAWGYGRYAGQYGMAILSKFPLEQGNIRTFQRFLWKDMPGALRPKQPSGQPWYADEAWEQFPLSSKSHWDVPVVVRGVTIHLLASHPTPPVFDGPEDRNGCRNHDEIRFWADYLTPDSSGYIVDDRGGRGGLPARESFVVLGDLNSDPADGDDPRFPIRQLLAHPRVAGHITPRSAGGRDQARSQGGANSKHQGDPGADTTDLVDHPGPGNLRLDYVLPARELRVVGSGVFWPGNGHPQFALLGSGDSIVSSDHRLVWVDVHVCTD